MKPRKLNGTRAGAPGLGLGLGLAVTIAPIGVQARILPVITNPLGE